MLVAILGPMFAGKTTRMLQYANNIRSGKPILLRSTEDTRGPQGRIVTHGGVRSPINLRVHQVPTHLASEWNVVRSYTHVFIDEG